MTTATTAVESTKALLQECKEAVVPLMETQTRSLDDIQNRFAEYESIVKDAADGDNGTLLVEDQPAETEDKDPLEESPSPVERGQAVAETLEQ